MVGCGTRHPNEVVPALRDALHAPVPELRKMALYVLRDLAIDAPGLAAELLSATRDDDVAVRLARAWPAPRSSLSPRDRVEPLNARVFPKGRLALVVVQSGFALRPPAEPFVVVRAMAQ
jgi:hypothetical protein